MTYRVRGLSPAPFRHWFGLSDAALATEGVLRVEADAQHGFPCRVTLEDAAPGERLLLFNHQHHDTVSPYRSAYAIYVREEASVAAEHVGTLPAMLERRTLALRGFDANGLLQAAQLTAPGEAEPGVRDLLERPEIAYLHAHNAAYGCFLARIDRT
jgi:hypothetical protein